MQATKVDGVFDCDPMTNPDAVLHRMLSYGDVRVEQLRVMDETAITLCKENDMPVVVFNLNTPGNILRAVTGDVSIGTTVCHMTVSRTHEHIRYTCKYFSRPFATHPCLSPRPTQALATDSHLQHTPSPIIHFHASFPGAPGANKFLHIFEL